MTDLREVTRRLAGVPPPPLPGVVAARLHAVLTGEVDRPTPEQTALVTHR